MGDGYPYVQVYVLFCLNHLIPVIYPLLLEEIVQIKKSSNIQFHGHFSNEEKEYRRKENLRSPIHSIKDCPKKINKDKSSSSTTLVSKPLLNLTLN